MLSGCDVPDFKGTPYYIKEYKRLNIDHPEWHSIICSHFNLNCDRVNKYEVVILDGYRFNIEQINDYEDDSESAEKWVKQFMKTAEFQSLLNYAIEHNGMVQY